MSGGDSKPRLDPRVAREVHEHDAWRHYVRLGWFLAIYLGCAWGAWKLSHVVTGQPLLWAVLSLLYLGAAASLHGVSLFAHEAVHQTLSRHAWWNRVLGAACALPVLQNCSAYRVLHLRHHHHLGEGGDPDHYDNYTCWSTGVFLLHWLRLVVGYPVYIVAIPWLGFRRGTIADRWGILVELAVLAVVMVVMLLAPLPEGLLWHGWLVPMLIINFMVNVRGMSQHTLLPDASDEVRGTRSILTGRVVSFFMCHENLHLEHHLYPGVPWFHLPRVHRELHGELARRGAPYIKSYTAFIFEFMCYSVKRCFEMARPASGRGGRNG